MPGVVRRSVDKLVDAAKEAADLGIPAICLFPYTDPAKKTKDCAEGMEPKQSVQHGNSRDQGGGS